jgi:hypothetical protein
MEAGGGGFHPSGASRPAEEPHAAGGEGEASLTALLLGDIRGHPRREGGRLIHVQHWHWRGWTPRSRLVTDRGAAGAQFIRCKGKL